MAALGSMTMDVSQKQRLSLLRSLLKDLKHPFDNPSDLSHVVSTIKTYELLSESFPQSLEKDLVEEWKEAVDSWVKRLLALASSRSPDKCWAGICLLGVMCQECSPERFLSSYSEWLNKLLDHIQPQAVSQFVKAAACAALSDLLTRLSEFSNQKDGKPEATKIIQPTLRLLTEDSSAIVLEESICLLCTIMDSFPKSIKQHYDGAETAIVSKLMSGKCSTRVLKKLSYVLSLLPKSKADEDSWSLMMEKILLSINNQLNDVFQGLEEEARITETTRILLPPGKEPPPPLGGLSLSEQSSELSARRPERLLGSRICALMNSCCNMLTNSYPAPVHVPVCGVVALAGRVLMVDGSSMQSSHPFMTILKQEYVYSELPLLQFYSLEILTAVINGLSSQLLPHAANIARLLTEFLRKCTLLDLRAKAYYVLKILLLSMGVGIAIHVGKEVVDCVISDLTFLGGGRYHKISDSRTEAHLESLSYSHQKKRKRLNATGSIQEDHAGSVLEVNMPRNSTEVLVKIAALEALEALISVGGSMRNDNWRANVDHLLITLAIHACQRGWSKDEKMDFLSDEHTPVWADFQLATLRALLVSLISPGRHRPPYLALGLELFQRGVHEAGTKIAEYCGHALLTLEVLIHPRALPLSDLDSTVGEYKFGSRSFHDPVNPSGHIQLSTFQTWALDKGAYEPESDDDELNRNWRGSDNDKSETRVADGQPNANQTDKLPLSTSYSPPKEFPSSAGTSVLQIDKPTPTASDSSPKELPPMAVTSVVRVPEVKPSTSHLFDSGAHDEVIVETSSNGNNDVLMIESPKVRNANVERLDSGPTTDGSAVGESSRGGLKSDESEETKENAVLLEKNISTEGKASNSEQKVPETMDDRFSKVLEKISATISNIKKRNNESMFGTDSDSEDPLPDIVMDESDLDSDS